MASDTLALVDTIQNDSSVISVQLHAEELAVSKLQVASSLVRVEVATHSRDQIVDETLNYERVVIERITINQPIETAPPLRVEGDTTILSVVEEVLVVSRQLMLKEEVRMRRVQVTEAHHEVVTLREQEAVITRVALGTGASESAGLPLASHPQQTVQEDNS